MRAGLVLRVLLATALASVSCSDGADDANAEALGSTTTAASVASTVASSTTTIPTTTTATTTTTPTTTTPPSLTDDEALAIAADYFEAYNAGASDEVVALFTTESTFSDNFGPQDRTTWEQLLAWDIGQGTLLDSIACDSSGGDNGTVIVTCTFENLDALVQAVDGPGVPVTQTFTVSQDGITDWHFKFGQPDFNTVWNPFREWMATKHPDDVDRVGIFSWTTVEGAEENGRLTAQFAAAWKEYLDEMDCSYSDGC